MFGRTKAIIKFVIPASMLRWYRFRKRKKIHGEFAALSAREVFSRIYRENLWGGKPGELCSGSGSFDEYANNYAKVVRDFLVECGAKSVVDLGCGDFTVGKNLLIEGVKYTGVDIVPAVIDRNTNQYASPLISFTCLDIIEDDLPAAEVCLVKQVLQHLSNSQILKILAKTRQYRWVVITEHLTSREKCIHANIDKPHGPDTRLDNYSGVFLQDPPFNMVALRTLLDVEVKVPLISPGERLVSLVFYNATDHTGNNE